MDLRLRLQMAGAGLLAMLDPEKELLPTGGYEVAHDLGRWWDAVLRLEDTIGFAIPAEMEAASLRNLQRLTDNPDRRASQGPGRPGDSRKLVDTDSGRRNRATRGLLPDYALYRIRPRRGYSAHVN